nr:YfhO family protein [Fibrobacterota bacterium]
VYGLWNGIFGGEVWQNLANQRVAEKAFAAGAIRNALLLAALVYATWRWLLKDSEPLKFGCVLLAVTLIDLYWVDSKFIKTYPADRFLTREPAVDFLKADTSRFRVFGLPGAYERWQMQFNEIETTDGWTDNEYRLYREYRGGDYQQNPNFMNGLKQNPDGTVSGSPFLDLLNVKYLAYRQQGEGAMQLAENKSVLPRAWFASSWETVPDSLSMAAMKQPGFDARTHVIVSDSTPLPSGFTPSAPVAAMATASDTTVPATPAAAKGADASVIEKEWRYNHMSYQVENPARGLLILSELYFPNWKVKVNGKDAPILKDNYAFRGVALEPGSHLVILEYHSPWMRKGFLISGVSLLLLVLVAAGLWSMERKGIRNGN